MSSVANEGCQKVGDMQMRHPGAVERGEGESERERERRVLGGGWGGEVKGKGDKALGFGAHT